VNLGGTHTKIRTFFKDSGMMAERVWWLSAEEVSWLKWDLVDPGER